mmetsp:Transcript_81450/g.229368  ORF Transcript_81450/g.229368 Transcript_81450/m.229368 type:complete len:220 (-) Transcript_81450:409-1068(-)
MHAKLQSNWGLRLALTEAGMHNPRERTQKATKSHRRQECCPELDERVVPAENLALDPIEAHQCPVLPAQLCRSLVELPSHTRRRARDWSDNRQVEGRGAAAQVGQRALMEVRKDPRRSHGLCIGLLCAIEDALREEVCEVLALLSGDLRRRREGLQVLVDTLEEESELLEVHTRLVVNQRLVELCSDGLLLLARCPVADLLVRQRERLSEGQLLALEGI